MKMSIIKFFPQKSKVRHDSLTHDSLTHDSLTPRFTDNTKSVGIHIFSPAPNTKNLGSEGAVTESIKFYQNTVV